MKITFCGGAKSVTGANYLIETNGLKLLVDCGLSQGSRYSEEFNYEDFIYDASEIDFVMITHSHMDHIGRLPKLYKDGFRGQVLTTKPTKEIMKVAYPDGLDKIADEAKKDGHPPLYETKDIDGLMAIVGEVKYLERTKLGDGVEVVFHDAGHILGSAMIEIIATEDRQEKKILFTGDLGNPPVPLLEGIDYVSDVDYVVFESTYGSRVHLPKDASILELERVIDETIARRGVLMIPSFAVERTQELLYMLDGLIHENKIERVPVFLDSPLAIKVTRVYDVCRGFFNDDALEVIKKRGGFFAFDWLTYTESTNESKKINEVPAPKIIIAGSGMSQGGRILHHERRYLQDPKSTILFIGYQVKGSLGRRIFEGEPEVNIFGESVPVRAHVEAIGGFSAHADQNGLLELITKANQGRGVKKAFAVQGEEESAIAISNKIKEKLRIDTIVPDSNQSFEL